MKIYTLHRTQKLPITQEEAWNFLSDPHNLGRITPKGMDFRILSGADRPMFAGQIIEYTVKPLAGISTKWVTEITHCVKNHYFVDEQRYGPYALWHHKHFIRPVAGGVEMEDLIHYKLPLGILGQLAHGLFVKDKLNGIFEFRNKVLEEKFGTLT